MSTTTASMARMLTLLPWLQARGTVSLSEVAEHFGVSTDQLQRELATLTFVGPGQGGGELVDISYEDGLITVYDSQGLEFPLKFTAAEASALIAGLTLLSELPAGFEATASAVSALTKIHEAAGSAMAAASGAMVVDHQRADSQVEQAIAKAISTGTQLVIEYANPVRHDLTSRQVEPLRLTAADGRSYLEAWCHQADGIRIFRLDRIATASATGLSNTVSLDILPDDPAQVILPDGFDVTLHLQRSAEWVTEQRNCLEYRTLPDGTIEATLRIGDERWLIGLMLELGNEARVLSSDAPEIDVPNAVQAAAREALASYA